MVPHDDDEATAQFDLEALRRRAREAGVGGRGPDAPGQSEPAPLLDLDPEGPGPESMTRMDLAKRTAFRDEEHTANDFEIPSAFRTVRGEKLSVDSEAQPFPLAAKGGRADATKRPPPVPGRVPGPKVVLKANESGTWDPAELVDESVVSSAPRATQAPDSSPALAALQASVSERARARAKSGVPAASSRFARVPERACEVAQAPTRPADRDPSDDPWRDRTAASDPPPPSLPPASLEEPTIVPRANAIEQLASEDATIVPLPGKAVRALEVEEVDPEPNTIVPHLVPRDRNGRLAYEPAVEDLSSELLVERTGPGGVDIDSADDATPDAEGEDLALHTGDFESYDADRLGTSGVLDTSQRRSFDSRDLRGFEASFAPSISVKGEDFGSPEDLTTDPSKSLGDLRGYGALEDLATDPRRSLAFLRDGPESSWADDSAQAHFEDPADPSSRTEAPPRYTPSPTVGSAWPSVPDPLVDLVSLEPVDAPRALAELTAPLVSVAYQPMVSVAYQPKSSARLAPAWQSEADGEERALQDAGRWEDLCELLLSRLDRTPTPVPRSRLLLRLAGVLEDRMSDYAQAFDGLLEAYGGAPDDPHIVERLEAIATRLDRFPALVDLTMERLGTAKPSDRIALLANAVRWYEGPIGRPEAAGFYVSELERADPSHPVLLVRKANEARTRGDHGGYLELLQRALERTKLPRERGVLHLAIGEAQRIPGEAIRHFESAIEIDPTNVNALLGFERAAMRFDRFAEVQWALEQLLVNGDAQSRVDAHLRLADLLEKRFLKREEAARVLLTLLSIAPDHESARISLERCYLALRDFVRLIAAASARGELARTPREQGEAFSFAAEIAESKIGDQVGAAEHLRRATLAEPRNEGYLTRAARLAERMQEPTLAAEYRSRLADILEDPQKRAQQYVAIAASLEDPLAQRGYYERATQADPGCLGAWEALERIARELGDDRGVVTALRRRIEATDSQRVKAQLLVELGTVLVSARDEAAAMEAFDGAFHADPSNERAAAAVLDALVGDERFLEAASACELLVTAASRDREPALLYARLRTSAKISIGLGDLGKALGACVASMDALPRETQPLVDLVEILTRAPEDVPLGARANVAFERILARSDELEPDALAKLGKLLAARGEHPRAIEILTRLLGDLGGLTGESDEEDTGQRAVPADGRALLEVLSESLVATGDMRGAADMKLRLSRLEPSPDARYAVLVATIELLAHKVGDLPATRPVVEEALGLRPDDHWLLHTAMWLYGELDDWGRLSQVLERIVGVQETPERRAKSLFTLAQVVGDKLGDKARAAGLYDETLDADKKRLDAFEALTRMLDDLGDYPALEKAYRKMIARVRDDGDDELVFTLFKNLAAVYADRLGNVELAQKALEGAKRIRPDDTQVKGAAVDLLVARDELDQAVDLLRKDLVRDPHDRKSYELLYGVFLRQSKFDRALTTAQILADFRPSSEEEARFIADYPPFALGQIPGSLVEEAWASHLYHPDLDPMLTSIFAWMTPAVCRMRESLMGEEERMASFGKPLTRNITRHADAIRQMFSDASEILAFGGPGLLVSRSRNVPFAPALHPYGSIQVNPDALAGVEGVFPYLVGKRLAEQRPELSARGFFPAVSELTSMLATAVRVGLGERSPDPSAQKLDRALYQVMSDDERAAVSQAVQVAQAEGGKLDVRRWSQAADISGMRVGLLLAQDVRIAKKGVSAEPQAPSDLTPREKLGELYLFAISELYADLRHAVGVNLADGGPTSSALR